MKLNVMSLLGYLSLLLVSIQIFVALNLSFSLLFFLTILGQGILVFTVYKVLTDDYTTDKTFRDFYEDRPDLGE